MQFEIYEKGTTPLHIACFKSYIEIVQILIENGAKHENKDGNGWSALHFAVHGGNKEIVNLLISQGSVINSQTNLFIISFNFIS